MVEQAMAPWVSIWEQPEVSLMTQAHERGFTIHLVVHRQDGCACAYDVHLGAQLGKHI